MKTNNDGKKRKIVITGATGQIGAALSKSLTDRGYRVLVFSRDPEKARQTVPNVFKYVQWEPENRGWEKEIDGAYAVINLAGASIFAGRLIKKYAEKVKASRISCNRSLIAAMGRAEKKPEVYINGSSLSYYGYNAINDSVISEQSPAGNDWWSRDTVEVEKEAAKAEKFGIRTVNVRTSYVLSAGGSGLSAQIDRFRKGQSSVITPADSWRPWIHIEDETGLIMFAIENESISGPLIAAAPGTVTNMQFAEALAGELKVQLRGKMPGFILRMIMGNAATVFSRGCRAVPEKALSNGFVFRYPQLKDALGDLVPEIGAD